MANGIIDNKNTKDTDKDNVKQSSRMNFLKDITNNLWPTKLWRKARILATIVDACLFQFAGRFRLPERWEIRFCDNALPQADAKI